MAKLQGKFSEEFNKVNEALAAITSRLDRMDAQLKRLDGDEEEVEEAPKKKQLKEGKHRDFIIPPYAGETKFVLANHPKIAARVYSLLDVLEEHSVVFFEDYSWDIVDDEEQDSDDIWLSAILTSILEATNKKEDDWPYRMFSADDDNAYAVCKSGTDYWFVV